ncbi:MAG: hypothetical protein QOK36_3001 [Gaiellales bacterium]|jgi:uncharacterized protein (DUF1501 family)|nr:hypothetical protein [Gaiellales bacterium]
MARACADWHGTHAALRGERGRVIPIPERALDGLAEFERGGLSRRDLLAGGVGLLLAANGVPGLTTRGVLEAALAQAASAPDAPILVSLYLDGGNDGLNTLVPTGDARYRELRSRIGVDPATVLPLAETPGFGWHPSLGGLRDLYDAGKVAVLPAVDYARPDQSHFNSGGYWRSGVVGPAKDRTGWLGRTLDAIGSRDNPLQGIHVGGSQEPSLIAERAPVASVSSPSDFGFWIPDVWDEKSFLPIYRRLSRARARHPGLAAVRTMYGNTIEAHDRLAPLAKEDKPPPPSVPYPDSDLGKRLGNLARLLGANFGTRVAVVAQGGYDTHDAQAQTHSELLQDLGDSLRAWQADLDARGLSDRVLTLIWSEFGRRPEDNDSGGTDHGAGGLLLLVGNRVNGGIQSEFPGLGKLDADDNLVITTDFRSVYATLLEDWMGVEAARVLPKVPASHLPLLRAA